jgi:hypothetical protein
MRNEQKFKGAVAGKGVPAMRAQIRRRGAVVAESLASGNVSIEQ